VRRQADARRKFEQYVTDAIDGLPDELASQMDNVAIVVEDGAADGPLLGLYHGIDQTHRDSWYAGVLPDVITIYRLPLESRARSEEQLAEQVRVTVWHEIAHHFGISDDRLRELGWD